MSDPPVVTEADSEAGLFTVTDLRQYIYCPRVVYYEYCLPLLRPETYKMRESRVAHAEEARREARRSLRRYGLSEGACAFDVPLRSDTLGLTGRADMVIRSGSSAGGKRPEVEGDEEVVPVEYKNSTRKAGRHWLLQVVAYGLLLAEEPGVVVRRGFLYEIPLRTAEEVRLTAQRAGEVRRALDAMREMVERQRMPEPPRGRGRCAACEFRRFCNDL